ncbi:hypothetical protein YERSI8AC_40141 [Enterobacterales bacterium 8AC]|nr:hypothetical protein YERSI8AC_40141 [Enterobacterales bacterium 8AC]
MFKPDNTGDGLLGHAPVDWGHLSDKSAYHAPASAQALRFD